ncbi:hypothetical protein GQ457_10G028980 [Hibiscus cannabinus]
MVAMNSSKRDGSPSKDGLNACRITSSRHSAGPRICLGKELASTMMKATSITMIHNYNIKILKDHPAEPKKSVVFHIYAAHLPIIYC